MKINVSQALNKHPFKINIKDDVRNVGSPTKIQITFARIDSIRPIIWNNEVYLCLLKKKTMKIPKKMHAKNKFGNESLLETRSFYYLKESKDEFSKLELFS